MKALLPFVLLLLTFATHALAQSAGKARLSSGKGSAFLKGAPLPPDDRFKARSHGPEATRSGLKPDVLAQIDIELQRRVAAKNVAGVSAIIHKNGERGYFETFGMADIERNRPMTDDAIFRLKSVSKPVVTVAALVLFDDREFALDDPISNHLLEWKKPKVSEGDKLVPARNPITPRMLMPTAAGCITSFPENLRSRACRRATKARRWKNTRGLWPG